MQRTQYYQQAQKKITNVNVNIINTQEMIEMLKVQQQEIQALRKEVKQLQSHIAKPAKTKKSK